MQSMKKLRRKLILTKESKRIIWEPLYKVYQWIFAGCSTKSLTDRSGEEEVCSRVEQQVDTLVFL